MGKTFERLHNVAAVIKPDAQNHWKKKKKKKKKTSARLKKMQNQLNLWSLKCRLTQFFFAKYPDCLDYLWEKIPVINKSPRFYSCLRLGAFYSITEHLWELGTNFAVTSSKEWKTNKKNASCKFPVKAQSIYLMPTNLWLIIND